MSETFNFLTPVGRLVQGDCFTPNTKDMYGNPLLDRNKQPTQQYYIAIAINKQDPAWNDLWAVMCQAAQSGFPQGQFNNAGFSWKLIDGDGIDSNGKPYADREGFAGCWIVKLSSSFAPRVYTANGERQIINPEEVKRGYYVRVYGSCVGNNNLQNAGIYMNLEMVELIGYGEEIRGGADPTQVFGGAPAANLPAGVSMTPIASGQPMQQPAPAAQPMQQPAPAAQPMQQPAPAAQPMQQPAPAAQPMQQPQQQYTAPMQVPNQPAATGVAPNTTTAPAIAPVPVQQ